MKKLFVMLIFSVCISSLSYAKIYDFTQNNRLSLLEDGNAAVDLKIELIKKAKHHIHIVTFFWDDSSVPKRLAEELNKANERGVEVRILTSYMATLGTDPFGKGKNTLNYNSKIATFSYLALTPGLTFTLNSSLHEKIFLVDDEIAIIGGRNTSNSSLKGKDLDIVMEGPVVNQVQDHFKRIYDFILNQKIQTHCFFRNKQESKCAKKYKSLSFSEDDENFFRDQPSFENGSDARVLSHEALFHQKDLALGRSERLYQQDDILDTVVKIEFKKLRAYNYFVIPTPKYKKYLEENLKAGNSVEMITNSYVSAKFSSNLGYIYSIPDAIALVQEGLELYQWQRDQELNYVHEKVLIFNDDHVIVGSHNFGVGSTAVSNEIVIEFKSKDLADRLIEVFNFETSESKITKKADLNFLKREYEKYKMTIKILRTKLVQGILRELY